MFPTGKQLVSLSAFSRREKAVLDMGVSCCPETVCLEGIMTQEHAVLLNLAILNGMM